MTPELNSTAPSAAEAAFYATRMCQTPDERSEACQMLANALDQNDDWSGVQQIIVASASPDLMQTAQDRGMDFSDYLPAMQTNREKLEGLLERIAPEFANSSSLSMH